MNHFPDHHDSTMETSAEEEDLLILAEEEDESPEPKKPLSPLTSTEEGPSLFINPTMKMWKIMIVDDEQEIHEVTQLALQGFTFQGKPLTFISAHSGHEAKTLLTHHSDTALMLLDVVMETNDAGLKIVKYVRETLKNHLMRIVLRTGQPGEAPEESVIVDYDINDYKLKTELTQRRLFVTMVAGLRAYYDLITIEINKRFSKRILETVPVGVVVHNIDGSMHYANKRAIELLGKEIIPDASPEEWITVYQLYYAGTQQQYPSERYPVMLALQGQTASVDDLEIHQSTRVIPIETWFTPVYDEHGQIIQSIVAFQDITERKQAEANRICLIQEQEAKNVALRYSHEIELKNAQLVRLNQEKNEFLGIAAHDLKNPLSAILGLAQMIVEEIEHLPKEEIVEFANNIGTSAQQMFGLIVNLLDVNRIESGKFNVSWQNTDLSAILQKILKDYQERAAAKKIQLIYQLPTEPVVTQLDPNLTQQILDNLVSNAIKYSPFEKRIQVRLAQTEQTVRCEIQDEGAGLSKDDQQKLFGKFARLTTQPTGKENSTGLGLFIVKKLVTAMNGQVWCESELGKGTTFVVEFAKR
jgi:signal transduction histidine kinase